MPTRRFDPGFRFSTTDAVVLIVGAAAVACAATCSQDLAIFAAAAVAHFFVFCNVVRAARAPELAWAATFLACAFARTAWQLPWTPIAGTIAAATTLVIWSEVRRPSYHGVFWQRRNPELPSWWRKQRR